MRIHSVTVRFVLTLLLSTAVPFLAFGWIVRVGVRARLEEQVQRVLLADKAVLGAGWIDGVAQQLFRNSSALQGPAGQLFDLQQPEAWQVAAVNDQLLMQEGLQRDLQLVLLADEEGRVATHVWGLGLDARTSQARDALIPQSVQDTAWFRSVVEDGETMVWIDRHLSPYLHPNPDRRSRDPDDHSLGLALRTVSEGGLRDGVVLALLRWQQVQAFVDELAKSLHVDAGLPSARVMLCDRGGQVLASFRREAYSQPVGSAELLAAVAGAAVEPTVIRHLDSIDGWCQAGVVRVAGEFGIRGPEWCVVVSIPEAELFAASRDFGRLLLLITAAAAAVLVVWSLYASRAILRPVRELSQATLQIAAGELDARVAVRGQDELADLGRSFNSMATQLADSRQRLRDAERQAAWAEMARQVAHEIKNPLTPMRMSAQMVERARAQGDERLPELVERLAQTVLAQTAQLARIADDFRQFAGRPSAERDRVGVAGLLVEVQRDYAALAEERRVRFSVDASAVGDEVVEVDRVGLRAVFTNLLKNAFEAIDDGGEVVLHVAPAADGEHLEFVVRDDGSGIPAESVERLFEPYFTTRSSGTGLGLAISRRQVEDQGGRLWLVGSRPGATEFRFTLPRARPEAGPEPATSV